MRFIQLFHPDWDHHSRLTSWCTARCRDTDQASAALVKDLKQRGMLEDTLVIWGGEFGRTNYCQGKFNGTNFGRDHHPRCFTMWMAGGGVKPGFSFGQTDDYGYNLVDKSAEKIVRTVKTTGAVVSGPIPLPTDKSIITVNRSPHVNKKSREQFQVCSYKRLIDIFSSSTKTVDVLMKLELPSGVDVEIKVSP